MAEVRGDTRVRRFTHGLVDLLGHCVALQNGQKWRDIRSLFEPIISHAATTKLMPAFHDDIHDLLRSLQCSTSPESQSFGAEVSGYFPKLQLRFVARAFYGEILTEEALGQLIKLFQVRSMLGSKAFLSAHLVYRIYAYLPTATNKQLNEYIREFEEFNLRAVELAKAKNLHCPLVPVFDAVKNDNKVTLQECLQTIDEILFENIDVGASGLSFLLLNMASSREAQHDLRSEAMATSNANGPVVLGTDASAYVAKGNTFLDLCCRESRRLCPALRKCLF
ncbi:unnamed protein product [Penicillium manginii]